MEQEFSRKLVNSMQDLRDSEAKAKKKSKKLSKDKKDLLQRLAAVE